MRSRGKGRKKDLEHSEEGRGGRKVCRVAALAEMPRGPFSPERQVLRTSFHSNLSLPTGLPWALSPRETGPLERSWFNSPPTPNCPSQVPGTGH